MKPTLAFLAVLGFGLLVFVGMISISDSPETALEGEWKQIDWQYEKVDKGSEAFEKYKDISAYVENVVGQNLIIHESEKWIFLPDNQLKLVTPDTVKIVKWKVSGRGHILELKYNTDQIEHYNITELNENQLMLNFESDVQARGIAKLTFEKIK